jgi:hypothetical protein
VWPIYVAGNSKTYLDLFMPKCPIFLSDFNQVWIFFFRQMYLEVPSIKFRENPSSGSRTDTCGRTDGRGEAKEALFAIYENAPQNIVSRTKFGHFSYWGHWRSEAPRCRRTRVSRRDVTRILLKLIVGLLGLDSVLSTEETVWDSCYEIWE